MIQIQDSNIRAQILTGLCKALPAFLVLGVMGVGWLVIHRMETPVGNGGEAVEDAGETPLDHRLTLPAGKLEVGQFATTPVELQVIQHVHTVPGRIRYDESKHVEVKSPISGIVSELAVTPGDHVECGQLMAVLKSSEIGQARAEILKRNKDLEIAQQLLEREVTLFENLADLTQRLDEGQPISQIEAAMTDQSLGAYQQDLLGAYSKLLLARELLSKVEPLGASGSISTRTIREREADRQLAEAAYRSTVDQAVFSATQAKLRAEAEVAEAERQLSVAHQALETLLGYPEEGPVPGQNDSQLLSNLEIRAPFAGTVELRRYASQERVARGDSLLVLANTDWLYVAASIRESDWLAVSLQPGTSLRVTVPALGDRVFPADLSYVGREVATDTNSVPLIAIIDNQAGMLRPGMYVRVTVPMGEPMEALAVRPESLLQHENQQFVFVEVPGGDFQRVDVDTGVVSDDWVEVVSGLSLGQRVVSTGAFLLKSELLLQGEAE